jgi:hypothetical protein
MQVAQVWLAQVGKGAIIFRRPEHVFASTTAHADGPIQIRRQTLIAVPELRGIKVGSPFYVAWRGALHPTMPTFHAKSLKWAHYSDSGQNYNRRQSQHRNAGS